MRFTFANEPISRKPDVSEMWYFQGLKNYSSLDLTVDKIAEMCGSGYAWRASIYQDMNGTAGKKNCIGSQIISLDFDNCKKSPWEVMEYAENRGIPANFFYFTYSQNPNTVYAEMSRVPFKEKGAKNTHLSFCPYIYIIGRKPIRVNLAPNLREQPHYKEGWNFRVCWILEKATTPKDYELLVRIFMEDYFSEFHPDEACKDISRVWFGGKLGAFLYRTEPFSYQQFGYEKVIKKNEEKSTYDNRNIKKSKDGFIKAYADIEEPNAVGVSNNWWEYLNGRCDIWDRYQRGEYVPHNDMFKLCCELKYLKPLDTSRSIFKDIMRFYDPQVYEGHSFNEELLAKWFRDRTLKPVAGLVQALPVILPNLINGVIDAINQVIAFLPTLIPMLFDAAVTLFMALVESLPTILGALLPALGNLILACINLILAQVGSMLSAGASLLGGLLDGVNSMVGSVIDFFSSLPQQILDALGDVGSLLWDAGTSIINGLGDGLKSAWGGLTGWFGEITSQIPQLKGPLPVDAKLLVTNGEAIMGGLYKGLKSGWEDVSNYLSSRTASISASVSTSNIPSSISSPAGMAGNQTINNYYIGDTKLTTYNEQQFAQDFIRLMKKYERLATT